MRKLRLAPLFDADGTGGASSVEGAENATAQTGGTGEKAEETQFTPESVAKRIKEEKEKAVTAERTKWQQETASEKQKARDALIAEQGYEWNGKPITTEAEYKQALQEQELREKYKELPEEAVNELAEAKRFREEYQKEKQTREQQEKQRKDFQAFYEAFPDAKIAEIPVSVWEDVARGHSLVDAYTRFENQSLKQKIAKLNGEQETEQQNSENAASSTGSVKGKGSVTPAFFTPEQVDKMSLDEVDKNWDAIMESQKKWYAPKG